MKKDYVLFHLEEAKEALGALINEINNDQEYEIGNFTVDLQHLYWHINSSWNGKHKSMGDDFTEQEIESYREFPKDLVL